MLIRLFEERDVGACAAIMAATPLWQRYGVTVQSATERLTAGCTNRMRNPVRLACSSPSRKAARRSALYGPSGAGHSIGAAIFHCWPSNRHSAAAESAWRCSLLLRITFG